MLLLLGVTKPFDLGFYIETLKTKKFSVDFYSKAAKKRVREREKTALL